MSLLYVLLLSVFSIRQRRQRPAVPATETLWAPSLLLLKIPAFGKAIATLPKTPKLGRCWEGGAPLSLFEGRPLGPLNRGVHYILCLLHFRAAQLPCFPTSKALVEHEPEGLPEGPHLSLQATNPRRGPCSVLRFNVELSNGYAPKSNDCIDKAVAIFMNERCAPRRATISKEIHVPVF